MSKIKSIAIKGTLAGQGVIQFDGNDNSYLNGQCKNSYFGGKREKNENYGKYVYIMTEDENKKSIVERKLKLSSDGIRHFIHIAEHPVQIPSINKNKTAFVKYIANLGTLERGFMIADKGSEFDGLKRKSVYNITDAIEKTGALPILETYSRSGEKQEKEDEDSKSDTTFFKRESVGETSYEFEGFINLAELAFIPMSHYHDRESINEGIVEEFRVELGKNLQRAYNRLSKEYHELARIKFDSLVAEPSYYTKNAEDNAFDVPEKGILLTEGQALTIAYDLLDKMQNIYWSKAQTGFAKTVNLAVKGIVNIFNDLNNDSGFISLKEFKLNEIELGYQISKNGEERLKLIKESIAKAKAKEAADAKAKKAKQKPKD
jgi:hypothetical protein